MEEFWLQRKPAKKIEDSEQILIILPDVITNSRFLSFCFSFICAIRICFVPNFIIRGQRDTYHRERVYPIGFAYLENHFSKDTEP